MRSKPKCTYLSNFTGIQRLVFDSCEMKPVVLHPVVLQISGTAGLVTFPSCYCDGFFFFLQEPRFLNSSSVCQGTFNIRFPFTSIWKRQEYVIQLGLLLTVLGLVLKIKCLIAVPLVAMQWNWVPVRIQCVYLTGEPLYLGHLHTSAF